jgi:hypothetical protein
MRIFQMVRDDPRCWYLVNMSRNDGPYCTKVLARSFGDRSLDMLKLLLATRTLMLLKYYFGGWKLPLCLLPEWSRCGEYLLNCFPFLVNGQHMGLSGVLP